MLFCKSSPVGSVDTLWVKNFVEIPLSRSVYKINMFLHFTQKFKMATRNGGKRFLGKVGNRLCRYSAGQKFCRNLSISHRFRDKRVFAFYAEIQDGSQKWRENVVLQIITSRLCRYPVGQKFRRNPSISLRLQDKHAFTFYTEIQDGHQKWRKTIFGKSC